MLSVKYHTRLQKPYSDLVMIVEDLVFFEIFRKLTKSTIVFLFFNGNFWHGEIVGSYVRFLSLFWISICKRSQNWFFVFALQKTEKPIDLYRFNGTQKSQHRLLYWENYQSMSKTYKLDL